jgi:glucuronosyltransferase
MNFGERLWSTWLNLYEYCLRQFLYLPSQDKLAQTYFAHLPGPLPSVKEMERKASAILLNSHDSMSAPRPTVRGMVQVGGLHITKKPKPLPSDIQQFIDGATHGVIFFSLGTNLRSADMPPEKLEVFRKVFASLKQRVVWKFEATAGFSSNVMIKDWMPQSDILGHPKVKVFITHGGLLGTQEGVHRNVPLLGIPIYADQH